MRFLTLATIVAAGACFCGRANGSIVYNYVTNGSTFSASPGGTTSVNVYLQETVTGTDTSLLVSDNGLRGAGFSVTETGALATIIAINDQTGTGGNFAGGTPAKTFGNPSKLLENSVSASGPTGTLVSAGVRQVLLGSLSITVPVTPNTSAPFSLFRYSNSSGNTTTVTHLYDLDFPGTPPPTYTAGPAANFTVSSTPEPASMAFVGLTSVGLLARRRAKPAR